MQTGKRGKEIWFAEFLDLVRRSWYSQVKYTGKAVRMCIEDKSGRSGTFTAKLTVQFKRFECQPYFKIKYSSLAANDNLTHAHTTVMTWNDLKVGYWITEKGHGISSHVIIRTNTRSVQHV
jgi:hypothetical protein